MDTQGWGIGVNTDDNGEYISYGHPEGNDPNNFHPDYEVCSEDEIKNHRKALTKWKNHTQ